ncbi:helix-turn-helix transcriptional regulator [Anaerocolumna sp. AGMB13025]|uniref:helix-turn-helix domain-containing protein n=1 Tax=Anaerocolumna sp. AGMB13025 TaxID=3039116 RepID=UPI00241FC094|nr:helix-turn-helix transcriptional regulator [Anaerocolumna sp. AGMB13025]WFR56719.1 helix-turn-helix transcriptional regulator [Anaerocolumna sp. AGMB13025]
MSELSKVLGDRIRIVRNDKGLSMEELAHRANISTAHLGYIERGDTILNFDSIEKLVNALDITFEELFRNIQPLKEDISENEVALGLFINKLNSLKPSEQKEVLNLFELLLNMINNK